MVCNKCGAVNDEKNFFCESCGTSLASQLVNNSNEQTDNQVIKEVNEQTVTPIIDGINNQVIDSVMNEVNNQEMSSAVNEENNQVADSTTNEVNNQEASLAINEENNQVVSSVTNEVNNQEASLAINEENHQANNENNKSEIDNSIIRRSVKLDARKRKKGPLIVTFIATMIFTALVTFTYNFVILNGVSTIRSSGSLISMLIFSFVGSILLSFFEYLVMLILNKSALEISRGTPMTLLDVVAYIVNNLGRCLRAFGFNLVLGLIVVAIMFAIVTLNISGLSILAVLILILYFLPVVYLYNMLVVDDLNRIQIKMGMFDRCMELMKGHYIEYYSLLISSICWMSLLVVVIGLGTFLGLRLLSVCIYGILYIFWIFPYTRLFMANWYRHLNKETEYKNASSGITNELIIFVFFAFLAFIFLLMNSSS